MMRILYHHRTLGDGAEGIHIKEMVNAFRKLGHTVKVIGPVANESQVADSHQQSRFSLLKKWIRGPVYECFELAYNLVVYINIFKEIKIFHPDFIYDRYMTFNYGVVAAGLRSKIPVFLEVNSPLAYERANEPDEKLYFKQLSLFLEKKTCSHAFKTIVVSSPLKRHLQIIGVPADQVLVMPNGVNPEKFKPMKKSQTLMRDLGISEDNLVIGFTGILRPWHGIDMLVDAFCILYKSCPESLLLLVGDGTIRSQIVKRARQMGCENALRITGRVSHKEVKAHVSIFDIAVSPKTTFYASPMKIPEYMAMAKPVVAPDTGNIRDLIDNGKTGLLFKEGDTNALGHALLDLARDKSKRISLGETGLSEINGRLNWVHIAQSIIDIHVQKNGTSCQK